MPLRGAGGLVCAYRCTSICIHGGMSTMASWEECTALLRQRLLLLNPCMRAILGLTIPVLAPLGHKCRVRPLVIALFHRWTSSECSPLFFYRSRTDLLRTPSDTPG